MIRRPPRSTPKPSSAASDVYKRQSEAFFDKVFVMAEEPELRRNRMSLLNAIATLPKGIVDFTELPGF